MSCNQIGSGEDGGAYLRDLALQPSSSPDETVPERRQRRTMIAGSHYDQGGEVDDLTVTVPRESISRPGTGDHDGVASMPPAGVSVRS
jgi:hypothetical protein